jgi:hypothetical protein
MIGALDHKTVVRLVHGEPDRAAMLVNALADMGFADVRPARRGESISA